jgi:endonuclease/exonuclease/phosphatase family metal-dependent hydrolase
MKRLRNMLIASTALLVSAATASATDVPVQGTRLSMWSSAGEPERRRARVLLIDPAIGNPPTDPRAGSALVLSAGAATGQCRVELALDPSKWHVIGGDGLHRGYRYLDRTSASHGVRRILLRPGRVTLHASGADWPCDLGADAQRLPVSVELRTAGVRYCTAFGGVVDHNEPGRFHARDAPAPTACPKADLTVADLNILHGLFCPGRGFCRLSERVDLLFQWIVRAGCPDVVTTQEVSRQAAPLLAAHLATACPFPYHQVYMQTTIGTDDEMLLSRYPVVTNEIRFLYRQFRTVRFARIDHPIGPVDVFSTHLSSSSDGAQNPCTAPSCPEECIAAGASTVRQCQGVQMARYIEERHDAATPAVITGDFNESPGTFVYDQFVGRGWPDVYLAAGNPECDPATGIGCTSGRQDEDLSQLESPASNEYERIDFIFLVPPAAASLCSARIDSGTDADGDGTATRIFADDPNPFAPACGPAPAPICWPSDHEGMQLDLNCNAAATNAAPS